MARRLSNPKLQTEDQGHNSTISVTTTSKNPDGIGILRRPADTPMSLRPLSLRKLDGAQR